MTPIIQPYRGLQTRYMELLALAEEYNAADIFVSAPDWYLLTQCTPATWLTKDGDGPSILIAGRHFRPKPSSKPPHGTLDLTGAEPSFEA